MRKLQPNGPCWAFSLFTLYSFPFTTSCVRPQQIRWRERQAAELLALTREQELAILKAQLNPHFLFNTLNGISAMVTHDPEEARRMIARLAEPPALRHRQLRTTAGPVARRSGVHPSLCAVRAETPSRTA